MRKLKHIVPFILAVCLVFSLCFTFACKTELKELESLTLDTTNAQMEYSIGEAYSSAGLKITANYKSGQSEVISTDDVNINSRDYDAYTVGTYDIIVSYSSDGTTAEASYKVTVADAKFGGLMVTLKSDKSNLLNLSQDNTTEDLTGAADWIEVRTPNIIGEVDMDAAPLSKDSYDVKVYRNGNEVTETELGAAKRGVYQIVASMHDENEDYTYEGFALIVVFDDVESIAFKEGDTSQKKGLKETMTRTWKFTVTFSSGDTEVVDKNNPYLTLPQINPNIAAGSGTARVTYREPKLLSAPATTLRTVDVHYTLTGDQAHPDLAILDFGDTNVFKSAELPAGNFGTIVYKNGGVEFEVVGGLKGKIADNRAGSFDLPIGIVVDGDASHYCSQAFQSNSASTEEGMFINFTLDKNCEVYIYARSNGTDDRCMFLETENDYAIIAGVEDYLGINSVPTISSDYNKESKCSAHAASITGLNADNPAEFKLSFDASINVFYILIIFPEEAK